VRFYLSDRALTRYVNMNDSNKNETTWSLLYDHMFFTVIYMFLKFEPESDKKLTNI